MSRRYVKSVLSIRPGNGADPAQDSSEQRGHGVNSREKAASLGRARVGQASQDIGTWAAIKTITTMVLVSISPFLSRRFLALFFTLLALSALSTFAETPLFSVPATPYDHQMARIQPILISANSAAKENLSLGLVNQWMSDLRGIPYGYSAQWRTPGEVAHDPVADCKGKAVCLYERMRAHGAQNVRLVIGKRAPTSRVTHTWVEWTDGAQSYVLDPTMNWNACSTAKVPNNSYVAYFAFAGTKKFRASSGENLYAKL